MGLRRRRARGNPTLTRRERRINRTKDRYMSLMKRARESLRGALDVLGQLPSRRYASDYHRFAGIAGQALDILRNARRLKESPEAVDPDLSRVATTVLNKRIEEEIKTARAALRRVVDLIGQSRDVEVVGLQRLRTTVEDALKALKVLS